MPIKLTVLFYFSLPGSYRFHCLQWGPQEQLFSTLHPPLSTQWVPEGTGGCRGDLPRLWQVHSLVSWDFSSLFSHGFWTDSEHKTRNISRKYSHRRVRRERIKPCSQMPFSLSPRSKIQFSITQRILPQFSPHHWLARVLDSNSGFHFIRFLICS